MNNDPTKWDLVEEAKGIAGRAYDAGRANGKREGIGVAASKALTEIVDALFTTDATPGLRPNLDTLGGLQQVVESVKETRVRAALLLQERDAVRAQHRQALRELSIARQAKADEQARANSLENEVQKLVRELDLQYKRGYRAGVNRVAKEALKRDEEIAAENNNTCPGGC